jgi:hypothetical protein
MKITFPNKTAKEIVEDCDNKLGDGKLGDGNSWYKDEDFYTKEKCRPRTAKVGDIEHLGSTFDECVDSEDPFDEMMNFAEHLWFLLEYWKEHKAYPPDILKYSWTSSRSSYGGLVVIGGCDSDGVGVGLWRPDGSGSALGVRFSRSVATPGAKPEQGVADSLEARIEALEKWVRKEAHFINPFD